MWGREAGILRLRIDRKVLLIIWYISWALDLFFPGWKEKLSTLTVDYWLGYTVICHICCSFDTHETIEISGVESGQATLTECATLTSLREFITCTNDITYSCESVYWVAKRFTLGRYLTSCLSALKCIYADEPKVYSEASQHHKMWPFRCNS